MRRALTLGVLLAGGASTRMRQDKSQLLFEGQSLLGRAQDLLETLVGEQVLDSYLTSGNMQDAIPDMQLGKGPANGLLSVILSQHLVAGDTILAIPVDMPLLTSSALSNLRRFSSNHQVSCCFAGSWLPICLRISPKILQLAEQTCLDSKDDVKGLSMHRLFTVAQGIQLASPDSNILKNINTPQQWETFLDSVQE